MPAFCFPLVEYKALSLTKSVVCPHISGTASLGLCVPTTKQVALRILQLLCYLLILCFAIYTGHNVVLRILLNTVKIG